MHSTYHTFGGGGRGLHNRNGRRNGWWSAVDYPVLELEMPDFYFTCTILPLRLSCAYLLLPQSIPGIQISLVPMTLQLYGLLKLIKLLTLCVPLHPLRTPQKFAASRLLGSHGVPVPIPAIFIALNFQSS